MLRFIRLVVLSALGATEWGVDAQAASFDCKKAANDIERRICDDPDLGSLDSLNPVTGAPFPDCRRMVSIGK